MTKKEQQRNLTWSIVVILLAHAATPALAAVPATLARQFAGRLLRQSEPPHAAWYVHPQNGQRYLLRDDAACWNVARTLAVGITNADLARLDGSARQRRDPKLVARVGGQFVLAVEQRGALSYVHPGNGRRSPLPGPAACLKLTRQFGITITTARLRKIPFNAEQIIADPLYDRVATAKLQHGRLLPGPDADQILPIASLTKLATALVLLELQPTWEQQIPITAVDLAYPKQFVGPYDVTSEIAFAAGQTVTLADLWTAMLLASSNQAAGLLAKHSGLDRPAFVAAMNEQAKRRGLKKTIFHEPSGLDVSNVSTAREMAILAAAAFQESLIADTSVLRHATVTAQTASGTIALIPVTNRNYSLLGFGLDGAKTGWLLEAQRTVAVRRGDVVAVVLHARSMQERNRLLQQLLAQP